MGQILGYSKLTVPWSSLEEGKKLIKTKWILSQLKTKIMSQKDVIKLKKNGIFQSSRLKKLEISNMNLNFRDLVRLKSKRNIREFFMMIKPSFSRVFMKYDFQILLKNLKNIKKLKLMLFNVQINMTEFLMTSSFLKILKSLSKLEEISLTFSAIDLQPKKEKNNAKLANKVALSKFASNLSIKDLHIKFSQTNDMDATLDCISYLIEPNQYSIRNLTLDLNTNTNIDCSYYNFENFANALSKLKLLRNIDMNLFKSKKAGSHLLLLSDALHKLKNLTLLRLDLPKWDQISTHIFNHLLKVIEKIYRIETLDLTLDVPAEVNELFDVPFSQNIDSFHHLHTLNLKVESKDTPLALIGNILKNINGKVENYGIKFNNKFFSKYFQEVLMKIKTSKSLNLCFKEKHPFVWDIKEGFQIYDCFERIPNLISLSIELEECCGIDDESFTKCFPILKNLKEFIFKMIGPTDFNFENMAAIQELSQIEKLALEFQNVDDLGKSEFDQMISSIKNFSLISLSITINGNKNLGDNAISTLEKYLNKKTRASMKELSINLENIYYLSYTGISTLTAILSDMVDLNKLSITAKDTKGKNTLKIDNSSIELIAQSISKMKNLNELELEIRPCLDLTDEGILSLLKMLQTSINLKTLILNFYGSKGTKVSSRAAQILIKSLARLDKFEISILYMAEVASFI